MGHIVSDMGKTTSTAQATAEVIREAVEEVAGRTFIALVEATGIPRATLYRKLDGHGEFTLGELVKIATYLETTPGALISLAEARVAA